MKNEFLAIAAACALVPAAIAQPESGYAYTPPKPIEDRNAAIAYHRAWLMDRAGVLDAIPNEESLEAARRSPSLIGMLIEASKIPGCDFEIPFENGTETYLPHLTPIRRSSQLLIADARSLFEFGDSAGIAERLAAVIRLSDHTTNDQALISCMIAGRLIAEVEPTVIELVETGEMTDEDRALLVGALSRFDRDDPFRIRRAIANEVNVYIANSIPDLMSADQEESGGFISMVINKRARSITPERSAELLDEVRPWIDDVIAAWDADDAIARLNQIAADAEAGAYGVLGQKALSNLVRPRNEESRWIDALESMRTALGVDS